jgi:hypothetical protein
MIGIPDRYRAAGLFITLHKIWIRMERMDDSEGRISGRDFAEEIASLLPPEPRAVQPRGSTPRLRLSNRSARKI